ncbi:MAG: hypothetical protein C0615_12145 [Desulfuromonas sp.]|nr:MAG: hypothetical protein C0615_12145 [Desulfuromonas sp.]
MKKFFAVLMMVAFVAVAANSIANNGPAEVKIENKKGTITFNHAGHQANVADCATCHHNGTDAGSCRSCHDGTKAPAFKNAAHKVCKDCHKGNDGPTKCNGCHVK